MSEDAAGRTRERDDRNCTGSNAALPPLVRGFLGVLGDPQREETVPSTRVPAETVPSLPFCKIFVLTVLKPPSAPPPPLLRASYYLDGVLSMSIPSSLLSSSRFSVSKISSVIVRSCSELEKFIEVLSALPRSVPDSPSLCLCLGSRERYIHISGSPRVRYIFLSMNLRSRRLRYSAQCDGENG